MPFDLDGVLPGKLLANVGEVARRASKASFATTDASMQSEAAGSLMSVLQDIQLEKGRQRAATNADAANACLALESLLRALASELAMWAALREGRSADAWNSLIDAEYAALDALRAHPCGKVVETRVEHYKALQRHIFPPQVFVSTAWRATSVRCSICDADYELCDHLVGCAYMGEFCIQIISDAAGLHVAMVGDPADKRCRLITVEYDGVARDTLTGAARPSENATDG